MPPGSGSGGAELLAVLGLGALYRVTVPSWELSGVPQEPSLLAAWGGRFPQGLGKAMSAVSFCR